jgi:hypothetical protein
MKKAMLPPPGGIPADGLPRDDGPISWRSVSLSISGDDLAPDEITHLLGVQPDLVRRKGEHWQTVTGQRSIYPARTGVWSCRLKRPDSNSSNVAQAIMLLLDQVSVSTDIWQKAVHNRETRIFISLWLAGEDHMLRLPVDLMRRLANLNLRLDLDIYDAHDEPGTEATSPAVSHPQ